VVRLLEVGELALLVLEVAEREDRVGREGQRQRRGATVPALLGRCRDPSGQAMSPTATTFLTPPAFHQINSGE
jgi:hypothetical protein